jgi:phosphodiesterase/alkaline phosphatase D-like protein
MSRLVIGHVTPTTACVWARGEKRNKNARLSYRPAGSGGPWSTLTRELEAHRDYTTIFTIEELAPDRRYECKLAYSSGEATGVATGAFRTAPASARDVTFVLASCNYANLRIFTSGNVDRAWTTIRALATASDADFMVHCGDQIYADLPGVPFPDLAYYQEEYKDTWDHAPTARVLASIPNYMMLDDHEIFDGFANDVDWFWRPSQPVRNAALEAYRQYQHAHNPQSYPSPALYYKFGFGGAELFALDVRSERWKTKDPQMVSALQMDEFMRWLADHAADPKFVVTSIPFVGEVRDRDDKWCGDQFRAQREALVDFIALKRIGRLCFLTGDMHSSYHLTMTITPPPATGLPALTVHELMASPIHQFPAGSHGFIASPAAQTTAAGVTYQTSPLDYGQFYGTDSNVMIVTYRAGARSVEWGIHSTKDPTGPSVAGSFPF